MTNNTTQPVDPAEQQDLQPAAVVVVRADGTVAAAAAIADAFGGFTRAVGRLTIALTASTSGLCKAFAAADRVRLLECVDVEAAVRQRPRPRTRPQSWRRAAPTLAEQAARLTTVPRSPFLPPPDLSGEVTTSTSTNERGFQLKNATFAF